MVLYGTDPWLFHLHSKGALLSNLIFLIFWDCNFSKDNHTIIFPLHLVPVTSFWHCKCWTNYDLFHPVSKLLAFAFLFEKDEAYKSWSLQFIWTYLFNFFPCLEGCSELKFQYYLISGSFWMFNFFFPFFLLSSSCPAGDVSLHSVSVMPAPDTPEEGSWDNLIAKAYGTCSGKMLSQGKCSCGAQALPEASCALCTHCTNWDRAHNTGDGELD